MAEADLVEALLASTEAFGALEPEDLAICAKAFREVHFDSGRMLFAVGDPGSMAYLLAEGLVRLALTTASGRELSFRVAGPGELIGEIAAFDSGPRTADATAISPVRAYGISAADFDHLFETRPRLARSVIHLLCRRLRATTDQLEGIALHKIEVRLARFLLGLLGQRTAPPGRRLSLELGYSQSELARLVGSSRSKLNMALGVLEDAGAIKRTSDRLFCDPAMLAQFADSADD
ncbi:Crp/Fnr family transcriptional regulator [Oleomonas cavernae]|uniref:Crp/Fnr family transcriptional regulator n=1 Tax=Oleomonas cavernae TaxID=2320859 RepID=A0A418WIK8_9PROT|nr:Crp/Fnr family transcriptional regulator [Oleomonas cavernae]RJF89835.1 Crp/Fnr family transcriptional regulator [Oleomonas cavernae]